RQAGSPPSRDGPGDWLGPIEGYAPPGSWHRRSGRPPLPAPPGREPLVPQPWRHAPEAALVPHCRRRAPAYMRPLPPHPIVSGVSAPPPLVAAQRHAAEAWDLVLSAWIRAWSKERRSPPKRIHTSLAWSLTS